MDWFISLANEDQEFIRMFIKSSGSLKELANIYEVSYPTVRSRLNNVISKIEIFDNRKKTSFETDLMQMVIDEKIDYNIALDIIKLYKENNND
ncbi:DUF2089 domain-containing protein [Enterococcus faecium]|uniref:DUF2089 family protein n=1 Tax=Enterococcus TaxID=1350 RepID=UPI001C8B8B75|nr:MULTISPECIES: DUF2089 family protein [Enterococcus]MBX9119735.1 DUF2089 domain-containing protein [Enterococcus faecium]MBX9128093.1 DUF2089 domain-containing protein [Enterococcus casseliflavus]